MSRRTAQYFPDLPSRPIVMKSGISPPFGTRPITSRPSLRTLATPFADEPVEIVERRLPALLGEEIGERLAGDRSAVTPKSASAAWLKLLIRPAPVDDDDAVGRGVEDRLEFGDAVGEGPRRPARARSAGRRLRAVATAKASAPSWRPNRDRVKLRIDLDRRTAAAAAS